MQYRAFGKNKNKKICISISKIKSLSRNNICVCRHIKVNLIVCTISQSIDVQYNGIFYFHLLIGTILLPGVILSSSMLQILEIHSTIPTPGSLAYTSVHFLILSKGGKSDNSNSKSLYKENCLITMKDHSVLKVVGKYYFKI